MKQDELDNELRARFLDLVDEATRFAAEKRDVESLGQLAQLIGSCIDWDKEPKQIPAGFQPNSREEEDE